MDLQDWQDNRNMEVSPNNRVIAGMIIALVIGWYQILHPWVIRIWHHRQRQLQARRGGRINRDHMPRNTTHPLPAPRRLASSTSSQIPNATRATPISEKLKQQISSSVVNAEWSRGRRVIVNDDSISLFNAKDDMEISSSYETGSRSDYIPLRYLGLPVIPHHHAYLDPMDLPVLFTTSSTNSTPDHVGFSNQQIREMRDYFPGIRAIDYYIDGQVVVGLSQDFYGSAVEKVGYPFFKAWKYICVLVVIEGSNGDNTEDLDDLERSITPLSAGSKVWNLAGEYSTMGTFLHPDPSSASSSSLSVKYCSVSAHSFIRKIELGFFINPQSFAAMSLIVYLAYLGGKEGWGSAEVIQQILFLRMGFVLQGLVWKCGGRRLRWHIMVHFQEKLIWQTRTAGIQQSIPMTLWYAVFLIPRQARDILCTLVEAMLSLEGNTYYGSLRKIVVEILLTVWLVMWVLKKETGHAVLRNALSQTLRGTKDGNAEIRRFRLPLMWLFIGCGAGRGLSYFLLFSNTSAKIVRFAGLASLFWDFIVDVWQCDLKSTFRILHERLIHQIGRVISCYDDNVSRFNMYRCRNDLACAELDSPVTIQNPRPLIWDDTPAKDLVNKPLFLVGLRTRGIATGYNFEEVKGIEAAVGGWRHLFEETTSNVALDYGGEHAIIWRSARITIRGESGAMLARAGEVPDGDMLREWFAVAFQSHEISPQTFPDVGSPSVGKVPFWKVALRVPEELMLKYWAVVPGFTLYSLDVEVANKGPERIDREKLLEKWTQTE